MSALLSSLAMALQLSKERAWRMKSGQAVTGSLAPSKIVPVMGVEILPHRRQR